MRTSIKQKPVWSTEQTEVIKESVKILNQQKRFAWECGWKQIPWQTVKAKVNQIKKGHLLEIAMAYLFGYLNLPIRLSFSQEDDMDGADLVFKKTGIDHKLKIQLKWNNHLTDDNKYTNRDIVVVHVDDSMKPADVLKQFKLQRLLGIYWYKRITVKHLLMVRFVLSNI